MSDKVDGLRVEITGNNKGLDAAINASEKDLKQLEATAQRTGTRLSKAASGSKSFTKSMGRLGNVTGRTRMRVQNTSYQLQDMTVQMQMGTDTSRVMAMQMPQLLGGFGALGAVLGVVAGVGIPLLAYAFNDAGEKAKALDKSLDNLGTAVNDLSSVTGTHATDINKLKEKYGELAEEAKIAYETLASVHRLEAMEALKDIISKITAKSKTYVSSLKKQRWYLKLSSDEAARMEETFARIRAKQLAKDLKITYEQAVKVNAALNEMEKAKGPTAQAEAASKLAGILNTVMKNVASATDELKEMFEMAKATSRVTLASATVANTDPGKKKENNGGGGGGGGGGSKVDPLEETKRELEALQEKLATETEVINATYLERQELLRTALENKLITQEEYQELMLRSKTEFEDAMTSIEQQRQNAMLRGWSGALGDLAGLMISKNKKIFEIGKAAAIAGAVVSGYQAAVSAWEKGMKFGPWVAAAWTAASLAKTGALISKLSSTNIGATRSSVLVGGGGGTSMAVGAVQQQANRSHAVALQLTGGDLFSRGQVIELINKINDAQEDGAVVRMIA